MARNVTFIHLLRCLLVLAYVAYFTCAFFSAQLCNNHRLHHFRTDVGAQRVGIHPSTRSRTRLCAAATTASSNVDANETNKSAESTFWLAVPDATSASSLSNNGTSKFPAIAGLHRESGPLPPGAYKQVVREDDTMMSCLIAIGIRPPLNTDDGNVVWEEGVRNAQKLIDSGFNTFVMTNPDEKSPVDGKKTKQRGGGSPSKYMIAREKQRQLDRFLRINSRHEAEQNFYNALQQNTPPSILRSCHFMVNLDVPSILSTDHQKGVDEDQPAVPFGNGWMVRESVGDALRRIKGETLGSVVLEYCQHSPYHLDVLDSLFQMKREGFIQSISTRNFPPSLLRSAFSCRFDIQSTNMHGNVMNTRNLRSDSELGILCSEHQLSRHISAPLGGGLFTNSVSRFEWHALMASEKTNIKTLLDTCCRENSDISSTSQKWVKRQSIMHTLLDLSQKYQASVESISLRWLLQLNEGSGDSIIVGSKLGMDLREQNGGLPYNRHKDLREVLTFALEDDDMDLIGKISGLSLPAEIPTEIDHKIDFNNKSLWL